MFAVGVLLKGGMRANVSSETRTFIFMRPNIIALAHTPGFMRAMSAEPHIIKEELDIGRFIKDNTTVLVSVAYLTTSFSRPRYLARAQGPGLLKAIKASKHLIPKGTVKMCQRFVLAPVYTPITRMTIPTKYEGSTNIRAQGIRESITLSYAPLKTKIREPCISRA